MSTSYGPTAASKGRPSLEQRFTFITSISGGIFGAEPTLFEVEDQITGIPGTLRLWRKSGALMDEDLRQLWLHETRQVQRVMAYAGAREVIVDVLEFVEDDQHFGVLLDQRGTSLASMSSHVSSQHWLRNLGASRARVLFWGNVRRLVVALGIVHAQGLVHGRVNAESVWTEGTEVPDFRLGGLEWSLWLGADLPEKSYAMISADSAARRAGIYSFAEDWCALGKLAAQCLEVTVLPSGDIETIGSQGSVLDRTEQRLLKQLVIPSRVDLLEAESIVGIIDDVIVSIASSVSERPGSFVFVFERQANLGDAVYTVSQGEIARDDYRAQLEWVRADMDGGTTLLVPDPFELSRHRLRLVTESMTYELRAFPDDGSAVWDIAVCCRAEARGDTFSIRGDSQHSLFQSITVVGSFREARESRARLGPSALDWSAFARAETREQGLGEVVMVRRALWLIEIIDAVTKAFEIYPIEVLRTYLARGRRFAVIRAREDRERDLLAKRIGLTETSSALSRLLEDDQRDADTRWRISLSQSLGGALKSDVAAMFINVVEKGRRGYLFEIDDELPKEGPLFLRIAQDTGSDQVVLRRLRNIRALDTREDLIEMLSDPWRARRSSRESISELEQQDEAFKDLDDPKQRALLALWSTLPAFFVVGPPGVGKTKLATETIRRRFAQDSSTRMLVSAQGHDALDQLQRKVKEMLAANGLHDVVVVRSITPENREPTDEEVYRTAAEYLGCFSQSALVSAAPAILQGRVNQLHFAADRLRETDGEIGGEALSGLRALSSLILDAANIVISTANSRDIEELVEARAQFDWVIVEEAAKATGPELIGPLMLSGRRLLIGDHYQLPPFQADRLVKILSDYGLIEQGIAVADRLIGSLLRNGEIDELTRVAADPAALKRLSELALRLFEPFRSFVVEDESRSRANIKSRPISAMLTEQRRMDPAIARVVSHAFYGKKLQTQKGRIKAAEVGAMPFTHLEPLPRSPIVVVDFEHVSATGTAAPVEHDRPRWHNPGEVDAVIDVLRHIRAQSGEKPTLAVLSPYNAQVEKLKNRLRSLEDRDLTHLREFEPVRAGGFVGTVDSFQGNEADLVILSLVRNNPRTGSPALGFLRDRRRLNVALSRAKVQLIIVGSMRFLQEAVRGVNPSGGPHELSFLTTVVSTIDILSHERGPSGLALASIVAPETLRAPR